MKKPISKNIKIYLHKNWQTMLVLSDKGSKVRILNHCDNVLDVEDGNEVGVEVGLDDVDGFPTPHHLVLVLHTV